MQVGAPSTSHGARVVWENGSLGHLRAHSDLVMAMEEKNTLLQQHLVTVTAQQEAIQEKLMGVVEAQPGQTKPVGADVMEERQV